MASAPRTLSEKVSHFSGTIIKELKDGTEVISSYVDEAAGEKLKSGVGASLAVEAASGNKDETEAALKEASATQDEANKPKQIADPKAVEKAKAEEAKSK